MKLNPRQIKAVKHSKGPMLVVAGAGTGKTTVITERIKYLISQKNVDPQQIFAVTFTQKAAEEMSQRLDQVMPFGYLEPMLGTFHSVCDQILRNEALEIGINPNFTIMTQTDQWMFIKQHLFEFDFDYYRPLGNPNKFISAIIQFFSRLQDEDISSKELNEYVKKKDTKASTKDEQIEASRLYELSKAYAFYSQLKLNHATSDFGDLLSNTIRLFRQRPNILSKYRQQLKHFLVDEFQDTNYAQYQLIKLLAPPKQNSNLVVVGDDDQAIYKFRGAAISNILNFKKDYPQAKFVALQDNYRSTQAILDTAYQTIINNNPDRLEQKIKISKKLISHSKKSSKPQALHFSDIDQEIEWTINEIINLVAKDGLNYQDIAILSRSNHQLDSYITALKSAGIPYQRVSNRGLFDQDEIRVLLNLLQVIADPSDSLALFSVSLSHIFSIKTPEILKLINSAKKKSIPLWEILNQSQNEAVMHLVSLIDHFQSKIDELSTTQLLFELINHTHYLEPFIKEETIENQLVIKNINLFFQKIKQYERSTKSTNLLNFLDTLDLWLEAGENPGQAQIEDIDTISLMTIHAAKGLEFEAVFLGGLISGWFPSRQRKDPISLPDELVKEILPQGNEHLQEERRLFYVALTRAKSRLYCTYSQNVGGVRQRKISGLLKETSLEPKLFQESTHPLPHTHTHPLIKTLKQGKFEINKLSYSQIDTFNTCPLKYKYRYLLQIPAKSHHSLSFGRTMHQTLHQFHSLEMSGKKLSKKILLNLYKDNFIEEGYDSEELKMNRFKSGKEALDSYYKAYPSNLNKPILLEKPFTLQLNDIKLVGVIDRVDKIGKNSLEIIDYKTGTVKDQDKVDKDEQLTLYWLAAKSALNLSISSASLYFLEEGGKKITTYRTDEQIQKATNKLSRRISAIKKSNFPAKPDVVKCGFCEYSIVCPFAKK